MKKRMTICFLLAALLILTCSCTDNDAQEDNISHEIATPSYTSTPQPTATPTVSLNINLIKVSLGGKHSAALTSDGQLYIWGDNEYGQLGDGSKNDSNSPINITSQFNLTDGEYISQIALGYYHSMALSSQGRVFTWGFNQNYELGTGQSADQSKPVDITSKFRLSSGETIDFISSGAHHCSALTSEGRIFMWGDNSHGQLGDSGNEDKIRPIDITNQIDFMADEKAVVLMLKGIHSTMITSHGRLFKWGANMTGQLGDGTSEAKNIPIDITESLSLGPDESLSETSNSLLNSAAITSEGRVFLWGSKGDNALLNNVNDPTDIPIDVTNKFSLNEGETIKSIALGEEESLALSSLGKLFSWGKKAGSPLDITSNFSLESDEKIIFICTCNNHFSALTSSGRLFLWGDNSDGQIGNGESGSYIRQPYQISLDN